ncbi:hypothetical protein DY000_02017056 [Brassica cretica]|uniref:3'-5' exonuclease domain-containing protein n=1 Tax=Brassica cretica TaxID=69181 RepID=A0ABQ7D483_BRACR|nr:hypothetical protein DY000_02017056 [Brassica cretica]
MFKIVTEKCHLFIKEISALTDNAGHVFWRSFTEEDRAKECMWISTKDEDYLVGAIALHDETALLRPVFSDPRIYKVFHGAQNDVTCLQRDFHIYLANLFDTYTLQDWTKRPLSQIMLRYARSDTQYLLEITNVLTAELKEALFSGHIVKLLSKHVLYVYILGVALVNTWQFPLSVLLSLISVSDLFPYPDEATAAENLFYL